MLIAIVGPFAYPSSNANSQRVRGLAEAISKCDHQVLICPGTRDSQANTPLDQEFTSSVSTHFVDEYGSGLGAKFSAGVRGLFLGNNTIDWLKKLPKKPDAIILYGTHLGYLRRLTRYCKENSITLLIDIVEWYDPRHLPGGPLGPVAIAHEISMRWSAKKSNGLFVISRFLEKYYNSHRCRTLHLPPILSATGQRPKQFRESNHILNLCYVGAPGKKEEFESLFEGITRATQSGAKLKLHIAGITETEFKNQFQEAYARIREHDLLKFYGRIPNDEVRQLIGSADFLTLARRPARFSNAGFPYKVAESMMLGTPVLTNLFSDISKIVQNGSNSLIFSTLDPNDIKESIELASRLSEEELRAMKHCARSTALAHFSVEAHKNRIREFLESCSRSQSTD